MGDLRTGMKKFADSNTIPVIFKFIIGDSTGVSKLIMTEKETAPIKKICKPKDKIKDFLRFIRSRKYLSMRIFLLIMIQSEPVSYTHLTLPTRWYV